MVENADGCLCQNPAKLEYQVRVSKQLVLKDHLQGGALLYTNNETSHADSKFRLLNRTLLVKQVYLSTSLTSQTVVMSSCSLATLTILIQLFRPEQLNWLHFMMNFGSIVANDPTANFDGVRVDALDNVNADLLQIAS